MHQEHSSPARSESPAGGASAKKTVRPTLTSAFSASSRMGEARLTCTPSNTAFTSWRARLCWRLLRQRFDCGAGDYGVVPIGVPHRWAGSGASAATIADLITPPARERHGSDTFQVPELTDSVPIEVDTRDPRTRSFGSITAGQMNPGRQTQELLAVSASMRTALLVYSGISLKMMVDSDLGATLSAMFMVQYEPDGKAGLHDHPLEESYLILEGQVLATFDGEEVLLGPGDFAWAGVGCVHAFAATGSEVRWLETQAPQMPPRHAYRFRPRLGLPANSTDHAGRRCRAAASGTRGLSRMSAPRLAGRWLRPTFVLPIAVFWSTIDRALVLPMVPTIAADFHAQVSVTGWAITGNALAYAVLQLVWGPLQMKLGRVNVLWISAAIGTVAAIVSMLAPTLPIFIAARIVSGGAWAATFSAVLVYLGETLSAGRRPAAMSNLATATALALGVGTLRRGCHCRMGIVAPGLRDIRCRGRRTHCRPRPSPRTGTQPRRANLSAVGKDCAQPVDSRAVRLHDSRGHASHRDLQLPSPGARAHWRGRVHLRAGHRGFRRRRHHREPRDEAHRGSV